MADRHLHLLQVKIRPHAYIKDVISGCWRYVQDGIRDKGTIVRGFKIVGENRIIFVLDNGVDSAVDAMNAAYGEQIDLVCTPLRSYETFAEHVLGVDKSLITNPSKLANDGQIFWLQFDLNYDGLKIADFLSIWRSEAMTVFSLRSNDSARVEIELYKSVGQRQIHVFVRIQNSDLVDDIIFTLPMMKELGSQIQVSTKSVVMM